MSVQPIASAPKNNASVERIAQPDLTGEIFGNWTVLKYAGKEDTRAMWVCRCSCGALALVQASGLTRKMTQGCHKCYQRRRRAARTYLYAAERCAWREMQTRCYNSNRAGYHNYGGRGISVCERWRGKDGFDHFMEDMGHRPTPGHSLDRINVNGNYEPGNCRWATRSEQAGNRRAAVKITYDGVTLCLAEWAKKTGIRRTTLRSRMAAGWPVGRMLGFVPAKG